MDLSVILCRGQNLLYPKKANTLEVTWGLEKLLGICSVLCHMAGFSHPSTSLPTGQTWKEPSEGKVVVWSGSSLGGMFCTSVPLAPRPWQGPGLKISYSVSGAKWQRKRKQPSPPRASWQHTSYLCFRVQLIIDRLSIFTAFLSITPFLF